MFKKLAFAPIFLALFAFTIFQFNNFLNTTDLLFFSIESLVTLFSLTATLLLSSLFFVIFVSLASDWKLILPINLVAASLPFLLLPAPLNYLTSIITFAAIGLVFLAQNNKMKSYLSFRPIDLISPSVKTLAGLLIIAFSVGYFFTAQQSIKEKGFDIPDELIDTALKFTPQITDSEKSSSQTLPEITPEQLEILKQNPDLLRQYGLDPSVLDRLEGPSAQNEAPSKSLIKQLVKKQLQTVFEPYLPVMPYILAVLLFLTLHSFIALLSVTLPMIIWIVFSILEKTGFISFQKEMREVKKLVV